MNTTPSELSLATAPPRCCLGRLLRWVGLPLLGLFLFVATLWAVAALYFDVRLPWLRLPLVVLYPLALLAAWVWIKGLGRKIAFTCAGFLLVLAWWLSLKPSNQGAWQRDLAVLPYAEVAGNKITVHNVRNCDYRAETDFDVHHYDKTYALDALRSVDLFMVYWGSPHIAHTMVSFGFAGGDYLCFSIETRKKVGQDYSAIKGLFRQYELTYIAADERDLVRLRTNYRKGEDVYLFRLRASPEKARDFFLAYVRRMNSLHHTPQWYSAVTHNCTTSIRMQRAAADRAPWDWRMLANGHGDELLYQRGAILTNLPLPELKQRVHINAKARAADGAKDFSQQIRKDIPF